MKTVCTIDSYIDLKVENLRAEGRSVTAGNYHKAKLCLHRYSKEAGELTFEDMTEEFVAGFNAYLESTKVKKATISFYNRILRSIYNQAVKEGLVKNTHPFDDAYTKVVAKLVPVHTVKTPTGESVEASELSMDELLHQYRALQGKYNALVNKLSAIMGI